MNRLLERYAFAYIKKSGNDDNVREFLQSCCIHITGDISWRKESFETLYNRFISSQNNTQNSSDGQSARRNQQYSSTNTQSGNINIQNTSWSFWDCLLLQCCIDSLLSGRRSTNNITNINYGSNNHQSNEDKREDGRKLLALGIVAVLFVIIFHVSICYFYNSSRKQARKEVKIDYLDNKLKTFRNIEFASCAVSLIALIACAVYPVLPAWGLIIIGVHSLACFAGGLAFHMKHEEESENIEKARKAVQNYSNQNLSPNYHAFPASPSYFPQGPFFDYSNEPPPYSPQDPNHPTPSAPPAYGNQGGLYPNPSGPMSYAQATAGQQSRGFSRD